jgi:hypothetical protein
MIELFSRVEASIRAVDEVQLNLGVVRVGSDEVVVKIK